MAYNREEIAKKLKALIAEKLDINESEITEDKTFKDLNADSLDVVELIMTIEEDFGIEIDDDRAEKLKSVGDVVTYIQEQLS